MIKEDIEKNIIAALNECDCDEYYIGDGFYIRFYDSSFRGVDSFYNYGIAVGRMEDRDFVEYNHYLISEYFDGNLGDLICYGSNIIEDMAEQIYEDFKNWKEE